MKSLPTILATLTMCASMSQAQERTAAGALETQMSWSALSNMVKDANAKTMAAHSRIDVINGDMDAISNCANSGKLWSRSKGCLNTSANGQTRWTLYKLENYTTTFYHNVTYSKAGFLEPVHKTYGPTCTSSQLNMNNCAEKDKGKTCFTARNTGGGCLGRGKNGACEDGSATGFVEVFKCL